jgi:glutaredoxin 3
MAAKVTIYGKESCPYTNKAREAYGERAVYVDVVKDKDKLQEMLKASNGARKVPVIVEGEKVQIGYGGT